jgi:hypothetical protein
MMKPLTQLEHNVLSGVPRSNRGAQKQTARVKGDVCTQSAMEMQTVDVIWHNLKSAGFITDVGGYCIRTVDGDRALDPVGAMEHAQSGARG